MIINNSFIRLWSSYEVEQMRIAGGLAAELLNILGKEIKPGITTEFLDELAVQWAKGNEIRHGPYDYRGSGPTPFPKSICTSVNDVICHGIPSNYELKDGDIVNVDVSPVWNGWYGDTSATFPVGNISNEDAKLIATTKQCLELAIKEVRDGAFISNIGAAIQGHAEKNGFSVVREFTGHGVGRQFHTVPIVPHFGQRGHGIKMKAGMTFTIEPILNVGSPAVKILDDGWTAVTADGKKSAQFEHTVLVTDDGCEVLTV